MVRTGESGGRELRGPSTRGVRAGALVVVLAGVLAAIVLLLVPRSELVGPVDAVVVLGGGSGERLALGRDLAEERDVPLVLSAEAIAVGAAEGFDCEVEVVCLHPEPVNTAGEARTMRALAADRGWDRIAAATSTFHVNRARMLFAQCFGSRVDVVGAHAPASLASDIYRTAREAVARVAGATVRRAC